MTVIIQLMCTQDSFCFQGAEQNCDPWWWNDRQGSSFKFTSWFVLPTNTCVFSTSTCFKFYGVTIALEVCLHIIFFPNIIYNDNIWTFVFTYLGQLCFFGFFYYSFIFISYFMYITIIFTTFWMTCLSLAAAVGTEQQNENVIRQCFVLFCFVLLSCVWLALAVFFIRVISLSITGLFSCRGFLPGSRNPSQYNWQQTHGSRQS